MIFYFSATGNTRWAATKLAATTGEQLVYIPDVMDGDCTFRLAERERLGFVFPVHGWRPPLLVRRFIEKLNIKTTPDNYCFALCTAGDSIARTIDILAADLAKKGLSLDAAYSLLMPEAYVGLPFMDVDTEEKELKKKQKAARARKAPHRPCAKAAERSGGGLLHKCAGDGQAVPCRPRKVPAMRQVCIGMSCGQHQRRKGQASAMAPQRESAGKPYKRARLHGLLQLLSPLSDKGHSLRTPHKKQGTVLLQSRRQPRHQPLPRKRELRRKVT